MELALVDGEAAETRRSDSKKVQVMDNEFASIERVLAVRPDVWSVALSEGMAGGHLTEAQAGIIGKLNQGSLVPSAKQAKAVLSALSRLAEYGVVGRSDF